MKIESIKAGDVLLDVHSEGMGNTTMRQLGVWEVRIISIDHEQGTAVVRWNGNPERTWYRGALSKLRRHAPEWMRRGFAAEWHCYHCQARSAEKDSSQHRETCPHPKAVAWRKKRAKIDPPVRSLGAAREPARGDA